MTIDEFLIELKKCAKGFHWYMIPSKLKGGRFLLRAKPKRNKITRFLFGDPLLCPIEAVANSKLKKNFHNNFMNGGEQLGLSINEIGEIMWSADITYENEYWPPSVFLRNQLFETIYEGTL